ncbi:MAG: NfeD family protein [Agathobacter sp.]|nr:NfeD family protein [Agathobacter sp.]
MSPFVFVWLIMIIIFLGVELSTVTLTSIWFAAGALAAMLVAMFNGNVIVQVIAFLAVAFGLLYATKPWSKKFIDTKKVSTNADRAIGEEVRVIERVSNLDQTGRAIVHGMEWTVRTEDDNIIIEQGELVRVVRIAGVKLIVERVEEV